MLDIDLNGYYTSFGASDHQGLHQLPSFNLLDFGGSYKIYLKKQVISQSDTNLHPAAGEAEWNGVDMRNNEFLEMDSTGTSALLTGSRSKSETLLFFKKNCPAGSPHEQ